MVVPWIPPKKESWRRQSLQHRRKERTVASTSVSQYTSIPMKYTFAPLSAAVWKASGNHRGLQERDLHLAAASDGQMRAVHLRAVEAGEFNAWAGAETSNFLFLYVIAGEITFTMPGNEIVTMGKYDVVHLPFLRAAGRAKYSSDFTAAEIAAPGRKWIGKVAPLLDIKQVPHVGSWEAAVCRNRVDAYIKGNGPREYFRYRDVGSAALTERRIHIHDGGALRAVAETGWHTHTMSQIFMILGGESVLEVDGYGVSRMGPGDAMTLGAGMAHNVASISADYSGFEMCLPGDFDTTPLEPPR
jgi:uncharacterized cupin superfamily protein